MARPPLPIGTYGRINTKAVPGGFQARARYRDFDGVTRPVERFGSSATKAENRLKEALRDRGRYSAGGEVAAETKVAVVAEMYLRDLDESSKAFGTKQRYRRAWEKHLSPAVGQLRGLDVKVSTADRVLRTLVERHGRAQGEHAKVVLTAIMAIYVRHDALDANPVRELTPMVKTAGRERTALSTDSVAKLKGHLVSSPWAIKYDLVDLVEFWEGVGSRIGESLALDWPRVDFDAGTIRLEGTVIRVPGEGLVVQPHTKSRAGMRTIRPPEWVMAMLRRRHEARTCPIVFPSATDTLRDPNNTRKYLRGAVEGTEWEGLHPHGFRHYVATQLDAAGWTARQIADYLGQEHIGTTQEVYMDRGVVLGDATAALPRVAPVLNQSGG